jgi:DNA-binding NarL/FixJ family response regulator
VLDLSAEASDKAAGTAVAANAPVFGAPVFQPAPAADQAPAARSDTASAQAEPVAVVVLAVDPILEQGAIAYLRARPEVEVVPSEQLPEAEVALVIVDVVTDEMLGFIERTSQAAAEGGPRIVLVGDLAQQRQVERVVGAGLFSIIPRREADFEHVLRAITAVRGGTLYLPGDVLGRITGWLNSVEKQALEPHGLTASGLDKREVAVFRLVAEGLETQEIAERLNYSERTVKNAIYAVTTRLNLRNRAHAVAYAIRNGAI